MFTHEDLMYLLLNGWKLTNDKILGYIYLDKDGMVKDGFGGIIRNIPFFFNEEWSIYDDITHFPEELYENRL